MACFIASKLLFKITQIIFDARKDSIHPLLFHQIIQVA